MVYELEHPQKAEALFENWNETLIWSCLQNIMGKIFADDLGKPESAMALLGDFCFFAGYPKEELVRFQPDGCEQDFILMIPQNAGWEELIRKVYGCRAKRISRYATAKEKDAFDRSVLQKYVNLLPSAYSLEAIDRKFYEACKAEVWSKDLVSQYADYEAYEELGLGVVAVKGGEIVSGASSYARYSDGIEIEIDTKKSFRRQGLACACGAKLILECLKRGLYPSWDAHNKASLALAAKLGYHFSYKYPAYEIRGWKDFKGK